MTRTFLEVFQSRLGRMLRLESLVCLFERRSVMMCFDHLRRAGQRPDVWSKPASRINEEDRDRTSKVGGNASGEILRLSARHVRE